MGPNFLTEEMKKERLRTCKTFMTMVRRCSMVMLDNIVTIDKSAVSFHTPETRLKVQTIVVDEQVWSQ
jgi:hypothetical protein